MQSSQRAPNAANEAGWPSLRHWKPLLAWIGLCVSGPATYAEAPAAGTLFSYPETIALADGRLLELSAGQYFVPESRSRDTGAVISIPFYRLRSTAASPAAPIFLLAGGPGGSWLKRFETDIGRDEALFYQQLADVVILDQRGAGLSRPRMRCPQQHTFPLDSPMTEAAHIDALRELATACRAHWEARGVALDAYHTLENAADVDELRAALGYEEITLVAGSYGSHLALALIRHYPDTIARAMLRGLEGPDHTYDMPSDVLAGLARLAAAADAYEPLEPHIPEGGLIETLKSVQAQLARSPETVTIPADGENLAVTVGRYDLQRAVKLGADRSGEWPAFIISLARGDYVRLAEHALEHRTIRLVDAGPMFYMMDCASGISPARERQIRNDPAKAILGTIDLHYFATCDIWDAPDLGDEFRSDVVSKVPVLLFQGTWDLSTPLENGPEVARGFRNGHYVEVEGGTHATFDDLYALWPPMKDTVTRFVRGEALQLPERIELPPVEFRVPE